MSRAGVRWDDRAALARFRASLRMRQAGKVVHSLFSMLNRRRRAPSGNGTGSRRRSKTSPAARAGPRSQQRGRAAGKVLCWRSGPSGHIFSMAERWEARAPPVAALRARVIATALDRPGDTVGYGAAWRAERPCVDRDARRGVCRRSPNARRAPQGVGASGNIMRGVDRQDSVPLLGQVTMDMVHHPTYSPANSRHRRQCDATLVVRAWCRMISIDLLRAEWRASNPTLTELLTRLGPDRPRCYLRCRR